MQFGPTMRMPLRRTMSTSSACPAIPCGPASAKPVVMMTQQPTPASAASRTPGTSAPGGTARMATSAGVGASPIDGYALRPTISARRRLIG